MIRLPNNEITILVNGEKLFSTYDVEIDDTKITYVGKAPVSIKKHLVFECDDCTIQAPITSYFISVKDDLAVIDVTCSPKWAERIKTFVKSSLDCYKDLEEFENENEISIESTELTNG